MPPNSRLAVAAAIIAFCALAAKATDCTATARVTIFSTVTACPNTTHISTTSSVSSSASSSVGFNLTTSEPIKPSKSRHHPHHGHHEHDSSSSTSPTILTNTTTFPPSTSTTPVTPPATTRLDCQTDNCLRHFELFSTDLSPFCATYTTSISTATSFPSIIENCNSNPSRVSSACFCINTATTPSPTPSSSSTFLNSTTTTSQFSSTMLNSTTISSQSTETSISSTLTSVSSLLTSTPPTTNPLPPTTSLDCQPDNCLRHFDGHSTELAPFCATYTTSPSTETSSPSNIVNCDNSPLQSSSACLCINTNIPGAIGYTPAPTSTPTSSPGSTVVGNSGIATSMPTSASVCGVTVVFETRTEVKTVFTTVGVSGVGSTSESYVLSTSESTSFSNLSSTSSTSSPVSSVSSSASFSSTLTADPVTASDRWSEGWKGRKGPEGRNHGPWGRLNWDN